MSEKEDQRAERTAKKKLRQGKSPKTAASPFIDNGKSLEDRTKSSLYTQAKKMRIEGRSKMNKKELARAIRKAG